MSCACNCHQSRDRPLKRVPSSLIEWEEFGKFCPIRGTAIKIKTTFLGVKKKAKYVNNPYKSSHSYLNKAFLKNAYWFIKCLLKKLFKEMSHFSNKHNMVKTHFDDFYSKVLLLNQTQDSLHIISELLSSKRVLALLGDLSPISRNLHKQLLSWWSLTLGSTLKSFLFIH